MKYSILLTVFNREPEVLLATLHSLSQCDLTDTEIVVVNDCSAMRYGFVREYMQAKFENGGWHDMEPYTAFRLEGGFNNPARAFNQAALLSKGENLFIMSSDVLVPPRVFEKARKVDLSKTLWTPFVEDTHGNPPLMGVYCGPNRLFPMPWFLGVSREALFAVKGWDEKYLEGLCFEDNDVVGRLALHTGRFMGDWSVKVYHQGHSQPAYNLDDPIVLAANERNREWTREKWRGIPFDSEFTPFNVTRKMQEDGNAAHVCTDKTGKLAEAVEKTTGLLANAEAWHVSTR